MLAEAAQTLNRQWIGIDIAIHAVKRVAAGDLDVKHAVRHYPRMQILSVPEILEGKRFQRPTPMGKTETGQKD